MTLTERSARKELRALIERAVAREDGLPDGTARRVANRILRQSGRIAELGEALRATGENPLPTRTSAVGSASVVSAAAAMIEPAPAFDPYEVGAVVTLHRHGAGALLDRLSGISSVENLISLAKAQNLALKSGWSGADELRAAIVSCAEQRLAERRAAAS